MNPKVKIFLIAFFPASVVYTSITAAFDYFADGAFRPYKLLFHFLFFGTFMGLFFVYNYNKQQRNKKK